MRRLLPCLLVLAATPAWADPGASGDEASRPSAAQVAAQVDALFQAVWAEAEVEARPRSSDAEFLRRASLDVTGAIPDHEQALRFLQDTSPDKRERLIQDLLTDTGYARTQALRWGYLLVGRDFLFRATTLSVAAMRRQQMMGGPADDAEGDSGPVPPLVDWLEQQLEANTGWDAITRELIAADGRVDENGAAQYIVRYARDGKAEEITGNALRVFQGLQVQCAQCHDHPYTEWTQQDFYGVAAFFARIAARPERLENGRRGTFIVSERRAGQIRIPAPPGQRGQLVLPRYLTGKVISPSATDRRQQLSRLITADDNPWFAKATVNRIWSFYFGRGLVGPVDDLEMADIDPAPAVFDLLAADFKRSGYDVRRLTEIILRTQAYQLTSTGPEETRDAELLVFARAPLRNLSAEQIFYSVLQATGAEDVKPTQRRQRRQLERRKFTLLRQFLQTFADDEAEEVVQEGTIPQALLLLNGPLTNDAVRPRPDHPLYDAVFAMQDPGDRLTLIYLRVLSRPPSKQELKVAKQLLKHVGPRDAKATAQAYADVVWALLNSPEFAFNH